MLYSIPVLSSSSAVNDSVILTEDDIPGASLAGQNQKSFGVVGFPLNFKRNLCF